MDVSKFGVIPKGSSGGLSLNFLTWKGFSGGRDESNSVAGRRRFTGKSAHGEGLPECPGLPGGQVAAKEGVHLASLGWRHPRAGSVR